MEVKNIVEIIGEFFYQEAIKKNPENIHRAVRDANIDIAMMKIHNVELKNNEIIITTERPGLLIGRRGQTIDALRTFIDEKTKEHYTINLKEDRLMQYIWRGVDNYENY